MPDGRGTISEALARAQALKDGLGIVAFIGPARFDDGREEVSVFDVVLDRDNRAFVDVFFDRPLGKGRAGEILGLPPATLEPPLAGVWRWRDEQILRFEPSGGFPMASEYRLALIPERLLDQGQSFAGDTELTLTTDRFLLEEVVVEEEPVPTSEATVVLRGRLQFNYPVDPRQLASLVRLVDPLAAELAAGMPHFPQNR